MFGGTGFLYLYPVSCPFFVLTIALFIYYISVPTGTEVK